MFSLLLRVTILTVVISIAESHRHVAYSHDESLPTFRGNWMSNLSDSTYLHKLSLAGTHDSMAFYGGFTTQTQSIPLMDQLVGGIRVLDIRCRHYEDSFPIHHGFIFQKTYFGTVLKTIVEFLDKYPSEMIMMRFRDEYEEGKNTKTFWEIYDEYVAPYKAKYLWTPTTNRPTLGEVRGKIVLLDDYTRYNASTTSTLASPYGLYYGNKNDFSIQDEYEILTNFELGKKWKFVKDQLILANSTGGEKFFINYLSASSVPTAVFPFFVASGHMTEGTSSDRLYTGFTDPVGKSMFPDFPRLHCVFGICMYYFEGTNILTWEFIQKEKPRFVGIIYSDFPGDGLIEAVNSLNFQ